MNQRPVLNQVLGGLGTLASSSLFRSAIQNLWITAPLGIAAYVVLQDRYKKGQLTIHNTITDLTPMVTLVATLVILNHTLETREQAAGTAPAPLAPRPQIGPVRDASFTVAPHQDGPIPAIPVGD